MAKLDKTELINTPMPNIPSVAGWKEVPIEEGGEKLVPLGLFSDYPEIFTDSIYFGEREDSPYPTAKLEGSLITSFVRESVAKVMQKAQELLPENLYLVVFDPYRTLKVQGSLYEQYYNELKVLRPDWDEEALATETQKYVSIPSNDSTRPSPHNTGGSVDVAIYELPEGEQFDGSNVEIVQTKGKLLNFGTPFDHGDAEAALAYLEKLGEERALTQDEEEARGNRRMLYRVMIEVGFEPFESEWWHFNWKESQMGAKTSGSNKATYGEIELSSENLAHEEKRRSHYFEQVEKFKNGELAVNPRTSSFPLAAGIAPSK